MFRKLLIASVLFLGLLTPFAMAPKAEAHGPFRGHVFHRPRFETNVHRGFHSHWGHRGRR